MDLGKREIVTKLYNILDERKAENIKVIDISGVSVMTDYFVIATAGNINHM
ncbi:MAG: RsfS/YbeB/iojap family protein, partial [Lachnospiraceae bacterium]|nr:RsfS/YbeB/iojap family protein [Lachnospiraceae bacterium]